MKLYSIPRQLRGKLQIHPAAGRTGKYDYVLGNFVSSEHVLTGGASNEYARISVDHDKIMNTVNIKDQLGRAVESYVLDPADRVIGVTNLEGQAMSVEYAVAGIVDNITRFDGSQVSFSYDGEARVTEIAYGSLTNSFSYDKDGLLIGGSNESGSISNTFNEAGWLTSSRFQVSGLIPQPSLSYAYSPAGQVSNVVSIVGTNAYSFDAAERLSGIQVSGLSPQVFSYSYNQYNGLVESVTNLESGLKIEYSFDVLDRVTNMVYKRSDGAVVAGFEYMYDNASMITNQTVSGFRSQVTGFQYDSLDRLISESQTSDLCPPTSVLYSYDLSGNRLGMTENGTNVAYTLGQGNRLATWGVNGENSVTYDAAGCVTQIAAAAGTRSLQWNDRYQLTSVSTNGSQAETYAYDLLGNLTRRVTLSDDGGSSVTNYHVYDGAQCIADLDSTGGVIRSYVWGTGIDNLLAMSVHTGSVTKTYYAITDHLGSVHALVDDTGDVVESYKFDAWGRVLGVFDSSNQLITESALGNRYLWQGREYSWSTGLYNFRARWYDPITGRWLSNDPIGISGGLNQYVFCGNNPVNFTDAFGLLLQSRFVNSLIHSRVNIIGKVRGKDMLITAMDVSPSNFVRLINEFDAASISKLEILGEGNQHAMNFGGGANTKFSKGFLKVVDGEDCPKGKSVVMSDGTHLASVLLPKLAPSAAVLLRGCRTAKGNGNISEILSSELPDVNVTGAAGVGFGPVGVNWSPFGWKTYNGGVLIQDD